MDKICDYNKCTGCSACFNVCPKNCISMVEDEYGFMHPQIDHTKCINCHLCEKTCPVNKYNTNKIIDTFAGINNDINIRLRSSSGGIFYALAKYIINESGVVFGATLTKNFDKVEHIMIDNIQDLKRIMGSKYVQSNIGSVYKSIKELLKTKKVLFVGTPCQVAGLKCFLRNDYDNLFLVEIVCHGVPSPKIWSIYTNYLIESKKSQIIDISFRNKEYGWKNYSFNAVFNNRKKLKEYHYDNIYMNLFLSDKILRKSCYNCNFKINSSYADIVLGDLWGADEFNLPFYDDKGISLIIINSQKGKLLIDNSRNDLTLEQIDIKKVLKHNNSLVSSSTIPNDYFKCLDEIEKDGFGSYLQKVDISNKEKLKSKLRKIKYKLKDK